MFVEVLAQGSLWGWGLDSRCLVVGVHCGVYTCGVLVYICLACLFFSGTLISGVNSFRHVVVLLPELDEVRNRRRMLGLTQGELAGLVDVSRTSLSKLENGLADLGYGKVKRIFDELERLERERAEGLGLGGGSLGRVHSVPVEYVEAGVVLGDVWARMVERDFSQFPVCREGVFVGSVSERTVNRVILDMGLVEAVSTCVEEVMEPPFPVLDVGTPVGSVIRLLQRCQGVLTSRGGVVTGIVTNSDVGKGFL